MSEFSSQLPEDENLESWSFEEIAVLDATSYEVDMEALEVLDYRIKYFDVIEPEDPGDMTREAFEKFIEIRQSFLDMLEENRVYQVKKRLVSDHISLEQQINQENEKIVDKDLTLYLALGLIRYSDQYIKELIEDFAQKPSDC